MTDEIRCPKPILIKVKSLDGVKRDLEEFNQAIQKLDISLKGVPCQKSDRE